MTKVYDDNNIFAKILRGEIPSHKVYEDAHTFVFMDVMPQTNGHTLVIPKNGSRNLLEIDSADLQHVISTTQKIAIAVKEAFAADGIIVQQFNEAAAGQTVFHTHFHVIPRYNAVPAKPHTGQMENDDVLAANAAKIRATLA